MCHIHPIYAFFYWDCTPVQNSQSFTYIEILSLFYFPPKQTFFTCWYMHFIYHILYIFNVHIRHIFGSRFRYFVSVSFGWLYMGGGNNGKTISPINLFGDGQYTECFQPHSCQKGSHQLSCHKNMS